MSDKIIVNGRMIKCDSCMSLNPEDKAICEIELSPPTQEEISNLKEGDEVLVKYKIFKTFSGDLEINCHSVNLCDITSILPQPQQSKQTFTEDDFLPEEKCSCGQEWTNHDNRECEIWHKAAGFKPIQPHPEAKFNPQSMDAVVWAKEFMRVYNLSLVCDIDEDRVKTWFANAIMAGFDEANRRNKKPELASERDYWDDYKDWLKRLKDGDKSKPEAKKELEELKPVVLRRSFEEFGERTWEIAQKLNELIKHLTILEKRL